MVACPCLLADGSRAMLPRASPTLSPLREPLRQREELDDAASLFSSKDAASVVDAILASESAVAGRQRASNPRNPS